MHLWLIYMDSEEETTRISSLDSLLQGPRPMKGLELEAVLETIDE